MVGVPHRGQGCDEFQAAVLGHGAKGQRCLVQGLLLVGGVADVGHDGVDDLLLGRAAVLPIFEHLLGARGELPDLFRDGAVRQPVGHLIDGIVDLIQLVRAAAQAVVQQLEVLRHRISRLLEFPGVLTQVVPQLIGLVQAVLGALDDVIHGLLCRQAVLLHQAVDATEGLVHVDAIQLIQRHGLLYDVGHVRLAQALQVLLDQDDRIGHAVHALPDAFAVHRPDDGGGLLCRLAAGAKIGVDLGHSALGLVVGVHSIAADLLHLFPHAGQAVRRLHQRLPFGQLGDLLHIVRRVSGSVSRLFQGLDQVPDGVPVIYGVHRVRQRPDVPFAAGGRSCHLAKSTLQLIRTGIAALDGAGELAAQHVSIIIHRFPRGGKELLQTLGVAPQPLLFALQACQVGLVLAQLTSRGFQFPLEGQILVLAQFTLVKRLLHLLLGRFQRVQFCLGLFHGVRQQLLLLLHQRRVLGV